MAGGAVRGAPDEEANADELWRYAKIDRVANVMYLYLEAVA